MNCKRNKHKKVIDEYRHIIGEQATIIKEQKEHIQKLQDDLQAVKRLSLDDYKFYLKEQKKLEEKNTIVRQELDRILTKFDC